MFARFGRLLPLLCGALGLVLLSGGCSASSSGGSTSTAPPSAAEILAKASVAMKAVTSAHFTLTVTGKIPDLQVQHAEGDLTSGGSAQGDAKITEFGQLIEVEFVIVAKDLYLKGATGGYTKLSAALAGQIYDPTAILNPDKGVAKVLAGLLQPGTPVSGTAYTVKGIVPKALAASLAPGIVADTPGTLTIDRTSSQLTDIVLSLTGSDGKPADVELTLGDFNKPVTVSAPS